MGAEVRREIEIIPAQIRLLKHMQYKYSCRHCQKDEIEVPVLIAKMPTPAFPGSLASSSTVAYIMNQKYVDGLPLYRQEKSLIRLGIPISRQTMANWVIRGAILLETIINRLKYHLMQCDIIHADETKLQVLREPGRAATTDSYIWLYRSGRYERAIVLYDYQRTRASEHPKRFLEQFHGTFDKVNARVTPKYLNADGYDGYDSVPVWHIIDEKKVADIVIAGCWSHARRYFKEAMDVLKPEIRKNAKITVAEQGFKYCNAIFRIERELKDVTPDERKAARLKRTKPILDEFKQWLDKQAESGVLLEGTTGRAVKYCINQWPKLIAILQDGRLEIDNNRAERAIRPFVTGRKNWLFANTPKGANSSAIIYSIVETAKENGLIPLTYLTYLFQQLPNIDTKDPQTLDMLMPWSETLPNNCRLPKNNAS
jgi:transposase